MVTLSSQQKKAYDRIKEFIENPSLHVFILKGYAGTGKTTMIQAILPMIKSMGKKPLLMAPTGRAAKVLSEKTKEDAMTIHKTIYEMKHLCEERCNIDGNNITSDEVLSQKKANVDDLKFYFDIKSLPDGVAPDRLVCVIDESSMISSKKVDNEIVHFGTDVLLDDLFTYGKPLKGAKFIFIGDPAQLLPVGDNRSVALDETYFEEMDYKTMCCELTDVLRQGSGSAILTNAMKIRDLIYHNERSELVFDRIIGEVEDITSDQIVDDYTKKYPQPQLGASVVICYSNKSVLKYNIAIRKKYFMDTSIPQVGGVVQIIPQIGDIVQIVKNNHLYGLFNGDFAQLVSVSELVETQSAPVYVNHGADRKQIVIELKFRDVTLLTHDGETISCKVIDSLLNSSESNLSPEETTALYINFRMRHPELKTGAAISLGLKDDLYFNALCVKYGYAITCHKAQGGEWPTVYVDYFGRTGLDNDSLRWSYTATTRASRQLFGVSMPNVQLLDKLQVNPITKLTKPAKNALSLKEYEPVSALPANASNVQKAKYCSVETALASIGCKVNKVEFYQYVDRYYIATLDGEHVYNLQYNGSSIYISAKPLGTYSDDSEIREALMSSSEYIYDIKFTSDSASLIKLYTLMQSLCDELGIAITNIVEVPYQVVYHLKTSGLYSSISFFYNNQKVITYAAPSSDLGVDDNKLNMLIEKLKI